MRAFTLLVAMLLLVPSAQAQDPAKPNSLAPKQIADGWLLLFDGDSTFGWAMQSSGAATVRKVPAQVRDGVLQLASDEGQKLNARHATPWGPMDIGFEYRIPAGQAELHFVGLPKPFEIQLDKADNPTHWTRFQGSFSTMVDRNESSLRYAVGVKGTKSRTGNAMGKANTPAWFLEFTLPEKAKLEIRNFKIRPLNTQSLFNGKDLTGWNVFPGAKYKSKFTVTDAGEINVKDGPGDLQTTGKFKDFVLQLECISHGKHLNSGVFFRCRDGEYQNGYEAQIRNQFTPEATQDYVVEDYDPQTNKLLAKRKIKGTAFDYGTGAIYRRQPARKEMSKDGEWFTMTVSAQGNQFATWVNGVQVTDWTDNRPRSDNARSGCRLEGGHLSIQGHDPTTDLSFRNLRIAETK